MFFVFNKQKIYTYVVSLVTVVFLFCVASSLNQSNQNTVQTSATNQKRLPIYNVETTENKVALTMNCAWLQFIAIKISDVLQLLPCTDFKFC